MKDFSTNVQKTVASLTRDVVTRNRDIISRRFGLKNGKKETLESIGKSYGITRERVRQIEEFTLKQLSKLAANNNDVASYVEWARNLVGSSGGIVKEDDLFKAFSGQIKPSAANASLLFILAVNGDLVRSQDGDEFNAFWAIDSRTLDSFVGTASALLSALDKNKKVVSVDELYSFARKNSVPGFNSVEVEKNHVDTCLAVSKLVNTNIFNEVGLVSWPEVKPRGVKDKAYLVLKRANAPKHFAEITKLINEVSFSGKKANVQTVHNELIKDGRFVLVGRGMYALSEWGYSSGTVKDVLVDILRKSQKPMPKASLVSKVMDVRMVKENTILLNLQDSKTFAKKEDGTYSLRKA